MAENLPALAVDNIFSSRALSPDEDGVYTVVEYRRKDNTLYMRSSLSNQLGRGIYGVVTLDYFNLAGSRLLHSMVWDLEYDANKKIVAKRLR